MIGYFYLIIKSVFYKPASIILSMSLLLFPTDKAVYSTREFLEFFTRLSEFS